MIINCMVTIVAAAGEGRTSVTRGRVKPRQCWTVTVTVMAATLNTSYVGGFETEPTMDLTLASQYTWHFVK